MIVDYVDDVMRVTAFLALAYFAVRWSTSTRWWLYWDTRAMFQLFVVAAVLSLWAVLKAANLIPESWQPWVAAVVWTVVTATGCFLSIGYEREQYRVRHRQGTPHHPA